jgi:hypothetical protein
MIFLKSFSENLGGVWRDSTKLSSQEESRMQEAVPACCLFDNIQELETSLKKSNVCLGKKLDLLRIRLENIAEKCKEGTTNPKPRMTPAFINPIKKMAKASALLLD